VTAGRRNGILVAMGQGNLRGNDGGRGGSGPTAYR
jgi:hypothetical protein